MAADTPGADSIICAAIEIPFEDDRAAYIARACGDDAVLRARVEKLVRAHFQAGSFLERPAALGETVDSHPPAGPAALPPRLALTAVERLQQALNYRDEDDTAEVPDGRIGPYTLVQQIGEGGMGTVFLAQQTEPVRRTVALKVIKAGMDSRQVLARFEAERQALALMDHPNIARVLDAGATEGGRPFFVMELIKGVPITRYCDEQRLTPRQRLELFVPVCQAVQHAHQKGVIHRDIKPSNVLVAPYDGVPVVKVIDFGIAKATGQQLTEHTLVTGFGAVVGTLEYMSPEQAELNQLDIDTRSDIYSLGVLLYELLTGSTPLEKKRLKEAAMLEVLRIIREEDPPRPSTRLSSTDEIPSIAANRRSEPRKLTKLLRGELDWIVMKALEKDRSRRYETANGFARDLERYLADEPVQACPPSAWYRLRKFARRRRAALLTGLVVALAGLVAVGSIGWAVRDQLARQEEGARQEAERQAASARVEAAQQAEAQRKISDAFSTARTLNAANKVAEARYKLAEARAQLDSAPRLSPSWPVAADIQTLASDLERLQRFLALVDQAWEAETAPAFEAALAADGAPGGALPRPPARTGERRPAAAVPLLLEALQRYQVLERDDWSTALEASLLAREQVEHIRRTAYEVLLWLADDVVARQEDHRSGGKLSAAAAARAALAYLDKAASAHRPTQAFHVLRSRCRGALGEEAAAQADRQLAEQTPPTLAMDHYLRGQAAYDARKLVEGVVAFEAALRLEPTHYWSLMQLGYCLCDLGKGPDDFAGAARVFTGCILKRPDHAHAYYCRGNAYSNLGQDDKAVADYSRAIDLDPKHAQPWYGRGVAYGNLGQYDKAVADCSTAVELDPKDARAWYNRGGAYIDLRQFDKAVADYTRAIELSPKLALAWNSRGIAYFNLRQFDKAVADFTRAIELDPKFALAWNNRGLAYSNLGQLDKDVADYSRAIELDPKYAPAWNNRGLAYQKLGRHAKAVADYTRAIELDPKFALAWNNRGSAYFNLRQFNKAVADLSRTIELSPKFAPAWYGRGAAYSELGQGDKAVGDCTRAIELDPKFAGAWSDRGVAYAHLRRYDKALADCSRAIELDPRDPYNWNGRGIVYCDHLRQLDKARADFTKALELDPSKVNFWFNRGNAHRRLGRHTEAVADYSRVVELAPQFEIAWSIRGAIYCDYLGQPAKAVDDFTRAIELSPKKAHNWYNRGNAYRNLRQYEKAIADYSEAIKRNSSYVSAWYDRGRAYGILGQYEKALADLSRAIELSPKQADAHNNLAWLLATCPDAKRRDPKRAVELAKKAVQLAPNASRHWRTLGMAHYRAGDWKASVVAARTSMKTSKGADAYNWFILAMSHWKLGNPDEARKHYDQALQWMEKNEATLAKDKHQAEELRRFRREAEEVLGLKKK